MNKNIQCTPLFDLLASDMLINNAAHHKVKVAIDDKAPKLKHHDVSMRSIRLLSKLTSGKR